MLDIILPCYNPDMALLAQALESIAAQSTDYAYSVLLIDDGSENRVEIFAELQFMLEMRKAAATGTPRISNWNYCHISHYGLPTALNTGHSLGLSKYICWTSDDNLLEPDFVQTMVSTAESGPFDFVRSLERHIPGGHISDPRHGNSALPVAGKYDGYLGASHIYTRELYNRTNGYDPEMTGAEDLDMFYQFMELGARVGFVDRALYTYRDHTSRFSEAQVQDARRKFCAKWGLK